MKPLLCVPLRAGLKFMAFIDVIVSALFLAASAGGFYYYEKHREDAISFINNPPETLNLFMNMRGVSPINMQILLAFCTFYYLQRLILAFTLFGAAKNESKLLIRIFVLYTLAIICVHALVYFTLLCFTMMNVWSIIIYVGGFIWQEWVIWASARFLEHLVNGTSEDDDEYDFASRRSSDDDRYSYKL